MGTNIIKFYIHGKLFYKLYQTSHQAHKKVWLLIKPTKPGDGTSNAEQKTQDDFFMMPQCRWYYNK